MENSKRLILCVLAIFFSYAIFSQENNVTVIGDIVDRHISNSGGKERLSSVRTIERDEVMYSNNMEFPKYTKIIVNRGLYQETFFQNSKAVVSFLDGKGWQINPFKSKKTEDLNKNELSYYKIFTRFLSPISDYGINAQNSYVENIELLNGEFKVDNIGCHKLRVNYKSSYSEYLFVSKENYMVLKIENNFGTTIFSNFKKVKGLTIPFSYSLKNSNGEMEIDLISININNKIDEDVFSKQ